MVELLTINEGLWEVKKRKKGEYHQRRNRRSQEGELIQIDGSPHTWFEGRSFRCCLINMVDDATGKIMEMRFVEEECLEGYFEGMKQYITFYFYPHCLSPEYVIKLLANKVINHLYCN